MLTSSAKSVVTGELPHSSKKLNETSAEDSHAHNNIGGCNPASLDIDEGKDESCRCKGEKTAGAFSATAKKNNETENTHRGPGLPMREGRGATLFSRSS